MEINRLRSIIRESISNNLKEIEDVAENAAMEAKLNAYTEAIEKVNKKIETAESLEEMQELVDPAKLNELKKHLKNLEKSKAKLEKVKAKKNKGKDVVTDEPVEEAAIEEDDIYKVEKMGGEANWNDRQRGLSWNSDQLYDDAQLEEGDLSDEEKEELKKKAEANDKEYNIMNEAFLKMQKLAGVITEAQYNQKKSLIENQLNEDYLELKSIGKQLYSFLKKKGYLVQIIENSSKSPYKGGTTLTTGTNASKNEHDGPPVEIHQLSDVEQIAVAVPVYALLRAFVLDDANKSFLEQTITKKGGKTGALNDPKQYWSSIGDQAFGPTLGKTASTTDIMKNPLIQQYIANLGKELTNIVKSKKPNAALAFKDTETAYVMYFADTKTAKGGTANPNQRPNAPKPSI